MSRQDEEKLALSSFNPATEPGAPVSRLLSLPVEVLCFILGYVEKVDLKAGRLACKALSTITTPILFREVVVVPHYGSLDALVQLAQHPTLSRHVQQVIVDYRWGIVGRTSTTFDLAKLRANFLRDFVIGDSDLEVAYLSLAFAKLPSLSSLWFRGGGTSMMPSPALEEMPSYYIRHLKRLGPGRDDVSGRGGRKREIGPAAAWLATFSAGKSIQIIRADGLHTSRMFADNRRFDSIRNAFRSLQILQLEFSPPGFFSEPTDVGGLCTFLSELPSLESLDLSGLGDPRDPMEPRRVRRYLPLGSVFQWFYHYPRLGRLSLEGFSALESEMTCLLETNAGSLRSLRLANIILTKRPYPLDESDVSETEPCWVRLIHGLQANLNLTDMVFDNYLSNRSNQKWAINGDSGTRPNSLKVKVENFVINGGDCPLDCRAVTKSQGISESESGLPDGGDSSWYEEESLYSSNSETEGYYNDDEDEVEDEDEDEDGDEGW